MGLAASLALSLASAAAADFEFAVRADASSSVLSPTAASTEARAALSAAPRVAVVAVESWARLTGTYTATFVTYDVGATRTPSINQSLALRLETPEARTRGEAFAAATRATLLPLTDAASVAGKGGAQVASTSPIGSESFGGGAGASVALDRVTLAARGSWNLSQGSDAESRLLLPTQQSFGLDASATVAATERDGLSLGLNASRTVTDVPPGSVSTSLATVSARWLRALSPRTTLTLGGGATFSQVEGTPGVPVDPAAEAGLDHQTSIVKLQAWARLQGMIDRFSGTESPTASASLTAQWLPAPALTLTAVVSGGSRTDAVTSFGALDVHLAWSLRPGVSIEFGVLGRWQRDERPDIPSFREAGAYTAVSYGTAPVFAAGTR